MRRIKTMTILEKVIMTILLLIVIPTINNFFQQQILNFQILNFQILLPTFLPAFPQLFPVFRNRPATPIAAPRARAKPALLSSSPLLP